MHPLFQQYCFTNGTAGLLHFTDRLYFMVTFWLIYGLLAEKFLASPLFLCYTTHVAKKHACGFF